jgi:hypothetical protein
MNPSADGHISHVAPDFSGLPLRSRGVSKQSRNLRTC